MALAVDVSQYEIHTSHYRNGVGNGHTFQHRSQRLEIPEAGRAHENPVRIGSAVADDVVGQFPARRFHHLIDRAFGHPETFGNDFEVIDQRFHLRLHALAVRQYHMWRVRLPRSGGHAVERLPYDAHALAHLFHTYFKTRIHIVRGTNRNFEIEFFVTRMWAILARIHIHAGSTDHRPGHAQLEHEIDGQQAHALGAVHPNRIGGEQIVILLNSLRHLPD